MTESFAQLFEESLKTQQPNLGDIIDATVVAIEKGNVYVDAGLKSEARISEEEFKNAQGELEVKVGDTVKVALEAFEDGNGETKLSREKAVRHESWIELEKAYEDQATVVGLINGKVKGGFTVELNGVRAFLPGSLVDTRPLRDTDLWDGAPRTYRQTESWLLSLAASALLLVPRQACGQGPASELPLCFFCLFWSPSQIGRAHV